MKILVVSSYLPFPLYSGGHIRLYNLLKEISKNHEITLVCEKRDYQTKDDVLEMEKFCRKVICVKRQKQWSLGNMLKSSFTMAPFLIVGHTNNGMKRVIEDLLQKEKFDLIHVETFYVMQNLPVDKAGLSKTEIPVVLAEHNIEYLVYKRFADRAPIFLKLPFYLDVIKMKRTEASFWRKANKLIAVSEDEKKLMKRENVVVVPNGVDLSEFKNQKSKVKSKEERRILFIGDFKWMQNRDSVEWILKDIWPEIKSKIKNQKSKMELKLWIVGRNIPTSIKQLGDENVIFDENNKQETSEIFAESDVLLAPIRIGGGTSYKILEAMATGIPVITTTLGAEGLNIDINEDIIVSNNPEEIAKMVIDVLQNEKLFKELSENARKVVEREYDWKIIAKKLEEVYESAINK